MDESVTDPAIAPEATLDNPSETPSAPVEQGQGAEQEVDFAERFDPSSLDEALQEQYRNMRGDYTKKTMSLAEERKAFEAQQSEFAQQQEFIEALQSDPETQRAVFEQLQEMLDGAEDPDLFDEDEFDENPELSQLQQRLDQMEQEKQSERQYQADMRALHEDVEAITKLRDGEAPDAEELELLGQFAQRDPQTGVLRVLPAYEALDKLFEKRRQSWIAGKRGPTPPGSGSQGSEKFDISDRESRLKRMAAIIGRDA